MKIYVAGSSKNIEYAKEVMQKFIEHGHKITYDWTENVQESIDDPNKDDDFYWLRDCAELDILAIQECDFVVALMTEGEAQRGTHFEMGIATSLGKPIYLIGGNQHNCIFYSLPNFHMYSIDRLLKNR